MSPLQHGWLIACLGLLLTACAGSNTRPDWVDSPQSLYPEATHLSAVGSADAQQTAADRALANLARIFEVAIADTSLDASSARIVGAGEQQQVINEQEVSRQLSVETRQVVEGATIAEYWRADDGRVYALATLDKAAAASRLRNAIRTADKDVAQMIDYASQTADSPVAALRALEQARRQQIQREELNRSLMVVADGRGVDSRYDLPAVEDLLRNGLAQLQVAIETDSDSIRAELQRALAQLGVEVVDASNLILSGTLDTAPVESREGWYWQRGSYELIFRDDKEVLAKRRWPIKVSATSEGVLDSRVRDAINTQLPERVFELLSARP